MEFDRRVMEVVEPRLKSLRELFQDRDVQAPDLKALTHMMLEAKFELLKLNDLAGILTRDTRINDIDEDANEDTNEEVPSSRIVDDVLNAPMTNYQREKLVEILSSVDQVNDRVDNLMNEVSKLGDKANNGDISLGETLKSLSDLIANYQIDDIADKVDQIYDEIKPGSLFPKIGNTVSWIDHNVKQLQNKLSECCSAMGNSLQQLQSDVDLIGDSVGRMAERLDALDANLIDCCTNTNNNLNQLNQAVNDGFNSTNQEVGSLRDDLLSAMMVLP